MKKPFQPYIPQSETLGKNVLAIDPGVSGGVAYKSHSVAAHKMPRDKLLIRELLAGIVGPNPNNWVCFMEQVGGYIGEEQPGSRMFTFGHSAGLSEGILLGLGVRVYMVRPQVWQHGIPNRGGSYGERKKALHAFAKKTFPDLDVTLATADALCILNYALRYGYKPGLEAKHSAAIAWCVASGYEVPEFGSTEFKKMFAYWCALQKPPEKI